MPLVVRKNENETWRQTVERIATTYGLQIEALEDFDRAVSGGINERTAAWEALYEWDLLAYEDDEGVPVPVWVEKK